MDGAGRRRGAGGVEWLWRPLIKLLQLFFPALGPRSGRQLYRQYLHFFISHEMRADYYVLITT